MSNTLQAKNYLHAYQESSFGQIEAERLRLFNTAYAPFACEILKTFTVLPLNILELGVGTGAMGSWLASQVQCSGSYVGIDKDVAQLEKAAQVIQGDHTKLLKIDLLNASDFEQLASIKPEGGFDLIYCRWVLCHIAKQHLPILIRKITDLLSVKGSFICEEPDYHSMQLRVDGHPVVSNAVSIWKEMVKNLQMKPNLGLDLEMNAEKLLEKFNMILSDDAHRQYSVKILGQSQPELKMQQKLVLIFGLKTAKDAILSTGMTEQTFNELYKEFEEIAHSSRKSVVYYTNTFVSVTPA